MEVLGQKDPVVQWMRFFHLSAFFHKKYGDVGVHIAAVSYSFSLKKHLGVIKAFLCENGISEVFIQTMIQEYACKKNLVVLGLGHILTDCIEGINIPVGPPFEFIAMHQISSNVSH